MCDFGYETLYPALRWGKDKFTCIDSFATETVSSSNPGLRKMGQAFPLKEPPLFAWMGVERCISDFPVAVMEYILAKSNLGKKGFVLVSDSREIQSQCL